MKKVICIWMSVMLLALWPAMSALADVDWPGDVSIEAGAGIVIDADSGAVLYGKDIHTAYPPASITKLLTALVVIENSRLDDVVTFSDDAVNNLEAGGGNKSNVVVGDTLPVRDCLYSMLLISCNQSANALAEHVAGSREAFVKMMNDKIASLGCTDSQFANPSGLNDDNQYVSAYDMALIAREAFANPKLLEIASAKTYEMSGTTNNPNGFPIYMEHKLLVTSDSGSQYYYPDAVAGKIGWTSLAGNTMATYASRDGRNLIAVVLKGSQPQYYMDGKALFDFGFDNFTTLNVADNEKTFQEADTEVSIGSKSYPPENVTIDPKGAVTLPKGATFSEARMELAATLPAGHPEDASAWLRYTYGEREVGGAWVYAKEPETIPPTQAATVPEPSLAEKGAPKSPIDGALVRYVLIGAAILAAAAGGLYAFFWYRRKKEREERERRRLRRLERLREIDCTEEEFERLVNERKNRHSAGK